MNIISILLLGLVQAGEVVQLEIVEDVGLVWESVELKASDTSLGTVRVRAATKEGEGASVLDRLELATHAGKVKCDKRFFSDLAFPDVGSIRVVFRADSKPEARDFAIRFLFGDEAVEERFPEVTIDVKNLRCVSRGFALPAEDGDTIFQDEPPPHPHWRFP